MGVSRNTAGGTGLVRQTPADPNLASVEAGDLSEGPPFPIIPPEGDAAGSRFTIGFGPDSDVQLGGRQPPPDRNPTCATIYRSTSGWIVVDGSVDANGNVLPSATGVFLNGRRVPGFAAIVANDVLQIPDLSGDPAAANSFVFVDPVEATAPAPVPAQPPLDLGESWFRRRDTDGAVAAIGSFRGIIDKYPENQDRVVFRTRPDGSLMLMAIDGMGGHDSGERAAAIGAMAFYEAVDSGCNLENTIEAMNAEMYQDNLANKTRGGAVMAGAHLHADGRLEVRTVGDSEVIAMSLPADRSPSEPFDDLRLDYWSTRPSHTQAATYSIPTFSDGRVAPGYVRIIRLDPNSNVVDVAGGMRESTRDDQTVDWVETEPGRIHIVIPMTDGLSEQYANHDEMMGVVRDHIARTGDLSPAGICDALLRDGLIRCSLSRMAYREGRPFAITSSRFRQAYREMTLEMDGVASEPPDDLPIWSYQSHPGSSGEQRHFYLVPFSGTAYVVRGVFVAGQGWMPDPYVVDPSSSFLRFNPAAVYHPSVVGRFKQDNISLGVAVFVREP
jgi:hypothetical protein